MRMMRPGESPVMVESAGVDDLVAALPLTKPVACQSVRIREAELLPRIEGVSSPADVVTALRSAGVALPDAQVLAAVLGEADAMAEIVALDAQRRLLPGAVAVFCSPRGDVVSVPADAADGGVWLTLAPASARRIGLACADLAARQTRS